MPILVFVLDSITAATPAEVTEYNIREKMLTKWPIKSEFDRPFKKLCGHKVEVNMCMGLRNAVRSTSILGKSGGMLPLPPGNF